MRVRKACLTRNSGILRFLRPCPVGASYGQEGRMEEWSREILSWVEFHRKGEHKHNAGRALAQVFEPHSLGDFRAARVAG